MLIGAPSRFAFRYPRARRHVASLRCPMRASMSARDDVRLDMGQRSFDRRSHVEREFAQRLDRRLTVVIVRGGENDRRAAVAAVRELVPCQHPLGEVWIDDVMSSDAEPVPYQKPLVG